MKAVKRSVAVCVLTLIMCVSLLAGVTFAWFSDSITNSGNTITAGKLSINWKYRSAGSQEDYVDVTEDTALFSESSLWQPGGNVSYEFIVYNVGSLPLCWTLSLEDVSVSAKHLTITAGEEQHGFQSGEVLSSGEIEVDGDSGVFIVTFSMDESAGNDSQNLSVSFNLMLSATQKGTTSGFSAEISNKTSLG